MLETRRFYWLQPLQIGRRTRAPSRVHCVRLTQGEARPSREQRAVCGATPWDAWLPWPPTASAVAGSLPHGWARHVCERCLRLTRS